VTHPAVRRRWSVPMTGRDTNEANRASTPLELLFDLTFVVAVGRVAAELAHSIAADRLGAGVLSYLMLFFAIYWAWLNFTWFASAFDTDDVGYRLLTLLQMAGVLILAASVSDAYEHGGYGGTVLGYVVMRVALVAQWLRVARSAPHLRATALRYAGGVLVIQVLWVGWTLLPWHGSAQLAGFVLLVGGEMLVPWRAEQAGETSWHPGHIAERYGLFTLIVLGECVLAASNALSQARAARTGVASLVVLGAGGLVLLFGLWWLYYLREAGEGLAERRNQAGFRWGYGHYGIFASLAALGAGLEVAASAAAGDVAAPNWVVSYAVAVPIAGFLALLWYLNQLLPAPEAGQSQPPELPTALATFTAVAGVAAIAGCAAFWPVWAVVAAEGLPVALLVANSVRRSRQPQPAG